MANAAPPRDPAVLVIGAGPAGLTLAADLLRRGVPVRIVSAAPGGFPGSRAKGLQPRTQEVLADLGALADVEAHAATYPKIGEHRGEEVVPRTMMELRAPTEDVPYPNTLLIAQHDTDAALRRCVEALGGVVEFGTRFVSLEQADDGVVATLEGPAGVERVEARFLAGADGGGSEVRRAVGVDFAGTTDESDRMIVADLVLRGLSRDYWHMWPREGRLLALCPLPGGELFQLMAKLHPDEPANVGREAIEARIRALPGAESVVVDAVRWSSVWRPNVRLADRYRVGRVLLLGDAAHVHPPAGAQGLNTGVQDAYNLGWKLGQVLAGAPDALLDTYEAERRPVAARVLGLSTEIYARMRETPVAAMERGDEERQLTLTYRGGPLAPGAEASASGLAAGDRVPDVRWHDSDGRPQRLFDHLRGPHFTVLALAHDETASIAEAGPIPAGAAVRRVSVTGPASDRVAHALGVAQPSLLLIRPDGYLAYVTGHPGGRDARAFDALALPARSLTRE